MKNMLTIFRREIAAYFNSPIGYIYLVAFSLINSTLYMTPFFALRLADMRWMFDYFPFLFCMLMPLISMRLWAEEKRENTIELLLTFPISPYVLVLGKFFASFVFLLVIQGVTIPIPIMLGILGQPDWGIIIACYLGTSLLGAQFLALGLWISCLTRDQIVAAILSLFACLVLTLSGHEYVIRFLDGWSDHRWGSNLSIISILPHYTPFTRGIVKISSLLYFVMWSAIFLFLNGFFLESRGRDKGKIYCLLACFFAIASALLFSFATTNWRMGKLDWTQGKIYSLSETGKSILRKLKTPVQITYYVTEKDKMPAGYQTLERQVIDLLEEMKTAGNVEYKVIHLDFTDLSGLKKAGKAKNRHLFFQRNEIKDMSALLRLLITGQRPFFQYIRDEFPELQKLSQEFPAKKEERILDILNRLLQSEDLYQKERFAGIEIDRELAILATQKQQGEKLWQCNRKLLQKAFEGIIHTDQPERKRSIMEKLLDKGIVPFPVESLQEDRRISHLVYSSLGVVYQDKEQEIIQPVNLVALANLEYKLISAIVRMNRKRKPVVALYAPRPMLTPEQRSKLIRRGKSVPESKYSNVADVLRREGYQVKITDISKASPLPAEYDALLIIDPRNLEKRQKWEIAQALYSGKKVFIAVQNYGFGYKQEKSGTITAIPYSLAPKINDLIKHYGVEIDQDILLGEAEFSLQRVDREVKFIPGMGNVVKKEKQYQVKNSTHIMARAFHKKSAITGKLSTIPYLWGSALNLTKQVANLQTIVLLHSTDSVKLLMARSYHQNDLQKNKKGKNYPLMVMIQGKFPDPFRGQSRPAWPKSGLQSISLAEELLDAGAVVQTRENQEGTLILLGCATLFLNPGQLHYHLGFDLDFIREYYAQCENLLVNSIENMVLGDQLIEIRSRTIKRREIKMNNDPHVKNRWRALQFCLMPVIILLAGLARLIRRRIHSERSRQKVLQS